MMGFIVIKKVEFEVLCLDINCKFLPSSHIVC